MRPTLLTRGSAGVALVAMFVAAIACSQNPLSPTAAGSAGSTSTGSGGSSGPSASPGNGPETPPFNLEAVLRPSGDGSGFGLVKFRQPTDDLRRIYLDTWVRDLAPNAHYYFQRAVNSVLDGACTGESWLTLGDGPVVRPLLTNDRGTGRDTFYRDLPQNFVGQKFDIHFRIVASPNPPYGETLRSGCYQFVVEPD